MRIFWKPETLSANFQQNFLNFKVFDVLSLMFSDDVLSSMFWYVDDLVTALFLFLSSSKTADQEFHKLAGKGYRIEMKWHVECVNSAEIASNWLNDRNQKFHVISTPCYRLSATLSIANQARELKLLELWWTWACLANISLIALTGTFLSSFRSITNLYQSLKNLSNVANTNILILNITKLFCNVCF